MKTLAAFLILVLVSGHAISAEKPSVLLIAIDDLNDWVGCLNGHPDARSPNIDRLAARGVLFTNAHCQAPICNPSRTSIMYGLRPSTSGIYDNVTEPWNIPALAKRVTLPRYLAANGYRTLTTGKIYHDSGMPDGDFEVVGPVPGQRTSRDRRIIPETPDGARGLWDFGPQTYDETLFQDHADATWAIEQLHGTSDKPFFLAIGFYRPHVPLYAPARFFKEIPESRVALPVVKQDDIADLPSITTDLIVSRHSPPHEWFVRTGNWQKAVQAYLACIRFTDEQVGRLLDALDASPHAKNTVVVLYSDHGFFLGEKEHWAKQALWERATHVPLIVAAPGIEPGQTCQRPVELLAIYPTLADLCGLPPRSDLDGTSLVPLLEDPNAEWNHPAITTHGRNNHAIRTERYRFIRYADGSEELYDHATDPHEWTNLAGRPEHAALTRALAESFPTSNAEPAVPGQKKRGRKK
jgi:arylsulfatase A-like enzyme